MRFFNCFVLFFFFTVNVHAQHNHYIYIQTENRQAFYIRLNEKVLSSTATGYLIIPKLTDGVYKLSIGFPKKEWPSQNIDITVNDKDQGFLLKNFGEKGWGLFNIQTMDILMAKAESSINAPAPQTKTDAFSNTLADVTNTPAIKEISAPGKQEVLTATDTLKAIVQLGINQTVQEEIKKIDPVISPAALQVKQLFTILDNTGRSTVYAINDGGNADTIRVFIPYENKEIHAVKETSNPVEIKENTQLHDTIAAVSVIKEDSSAITANPLVNEKVTATGDKPLITDIKVEDVSNVKKSNSSITIINPACTTRTTDQDFSKLQRKMAAAADDEARIELGKKVFKSKCLTTEQVKNLSPLFTNDQGRYAFYDAAYDHVSDIGNFKSLQSQLSEEYYINRFKAMLR